MLKSYYCLGLAILLSGVVYCSETQTGLLDSSKNKSFVWADEPWDPYDRSLSTGQPKSAAKTPARRHVYIVVTPAFQDAMDAAAREYSKYSDPVMMLRNRN